MPNITLPNNWTPRVYQEPIMEYFDNGGKRAVAVWHRRAGKDATMLHQTAKMAHQRIGTYWHCLPTLRQARKVVWENITKAGTRLIDHAVPKELRDGKPNEADMKIKLKCGSVIQLVGSDNFDALVGANPVHVTLSEWPLTKPSVWEFVRPILAENEGTAAFLYTPRGKNHGWTLYNMALKNPSWFCELLDVNSTGALPLSAIQDEREAGMPEDLIKQEYYCDFSAAVVGSYYEDLMLQLEADGSIEDFEFDPDGVSTHWDLGISDSTAIWFWKLDRAGNPQIIDCYEAHGLPISHFVGVLKSKPYQYVRHWLPHDAQARSLATGMSIMDQLRAQDLPVAVSPKLSIQDGIQAVRLVLQSKIKFHKTFTKEGRDALSAYHREYDEDTKTFRPRPEHDWSSHYSDAFRYLALSIKGASVLTQGTLARAAEPEKPRIITPTLDDLWSLREIEAGRGRARI